MTKSRVMGTILIALGVRLAVASRNSRLKNV